MCSTSSSIYTGCACSPLRKTCFGQCFRHHVTCNNCFSDKESSDGAILLLYLLFMCEPSSFLPPIMNKREIYVKEKIHFLPIPGAFVFERILAVVKYEPSDLILDNHACGYLCIFPLSLYPGWTERYLITVTTWMLAKPCCNNSALVWERCSRLKNRGIPVPAAQSVRCGCPLLAHQSSSSAWRTSVHNSVCDSWSAFTDKADLQTHWEMSALAGC